MNADNILHLIKPKYILNVRYEMNKNALWKEVINLFLSVLRGWKSSDKQKCNSKTIILQLFSRIFKLNRFSNRLGSFVLCSKHDFYLK